MWGKALAKVGQSKTTSQKPVLIGWGFEGPEQIQQYQEKAEDIVDGMRIGAYILAPLMGLIVCFCAVINEDVF